MYNVLEMKGIVKRFGDTYALNGVDLSVKHGETVAIIGPSGSGKSTLLRCVNHLETVDGGSITIAGEHLVTTQDSKTVYASEKQVRQICAKTGMVFQGFNLFPHFTCAKNIWYAPVVVKKMPVDKAKKRAMELLATVGLTEKADAYPAQLSGGQKQRVAIARGLAMEPEIMLFDEPTSALDPETTGEVLDVCRRLAKQKVTMLIVTHEIGFAKEVSDRVLFMDNGAVADEGKPDELLNNPQSPRLQAFLSHVMRV